MSESDEEEGDWRALDNSRLCIARCSVCTPVIDSDDQEAKRRAPQASIDAKYYFDRRMLEPLVDPYSLQKTPENLQAILHTIDLLSRNGTRAVMTEDPWSYYIEDAEMVDDRQSCICRFMTERKQTRQNS